MGKKKKYNAPKDPIKAMKKAARDLEMEMGVRFTYNHPHKSKKQYDRKNKDWKKDIQSLNFPFQIDFEIYTFQENHAHFFSPRFLI